MQGGQQDMASHVSEKQRMVCCHLNGKECAEQACDCCCSRVASQD